MRSNLSIKSKLTYVSLGLFVLLIIIQVIIGSCFHKIANLHDYSKNISMLNILNLQLRRSEKDFLSREVTNPEFYISGNSKYLQRFQEYHSKCTRTLLYLSKHSFTKKQLINNDISTLQEYLEDYQSSFHNLVDAIIRKGFKDYGRVGEMRNAIHNVEKILSGMPGSEELSIHMLTLRRHEKDYLLRRDLKYKEKFDAEVQRFKMLLLNMEETVSLKTHQLLDYLNSYQTSFEQVISTDKAIGLDHNQGLHGELRESVHKFENKVNDLVDITEMKIDKEINTTFINLLFIISGIAISFLIVLLLISRSIINPLRRIRKNILRISSGNISDNIFTYDKRNEIGDMVDALRKLTKNLFDKYRFASQIGKGDLSAELSVLGEDDIFGDSLLAMKENLIKAKQDEEKRVEDEKIKSWVNEGLALLSQVLQSDSNDIDEFTYNVIKNLTRYLNATQGGIFLLNSENNAKKFLELKACFAYDRRKYTRKEIPLGEGLLSACFLEKEKIYITDLPDSYMEITSGLGSSIPRSLLIVPLKTKEEIIGVMEIASLNLFPEHEINFVEKISENIATTISSVQINSKTTDLLELSKEQSEELKQKEEELEQNMEEMRATNEMSEMIIKELKDKLKKAEDEIKQLKSD